MIIRIDPVVYVSKFGVVVCAFSLELSAATPFPNSHHLALRLSSFLMSRRRSTSNVMGPPPDIVMGPPPVPAPLSSSSHASSQAKSKDNSDIAEKYRKLKRRFFELEEVSFKSKRERQLGLTTTILTHVRNTRKRPWNYNDPANATSE